MNTIARYGLLMLMLSGIAARTTADTIEQRFTDAQAIFEDARQLLQDADGDSVEARQRFHESAVAFTDLADDAVASVNLYVNTGNAYHFAGDNPRALLWYLRAAELANTPETRSGLATLRRLCDAQPRPVEPTSIGRVLMSWHYDVRSPVKQVILLVVYPVGGAMLIIALVGGRRRYWLKLGVGLMIVGGALGISDLATVWTEGPTWGVVLDGATGYAGDGDDYSVVIDAITPGQEVRIIEQRTGWTQMVLPSNVVCWVEADSCEPV